MQEQFNIEIKKLDESQEQACAGSLKKSPYFQQSQFWAEFKSQHGWRHLRLAVAISSAGGNSVLSQVGASSAIPDATKPNSVEVLELSVMIRAFAKGLFSIAYIPLFPEMPAVGAPSNNNGGEMPDDTEAASNNNSFESANGIESVSASSGAKATTFSALLYELAIAIKPHLPKNAICIRFDPAVEFATPAERDEFVQAVKAAAKKRRNPLKKNGVDIQPPDTTQIDLSRAEEEILGAMKSKWRYNINLAKRKGVQIEKYPQNDINLSTKIDEFYEIYKITSSRDGIAIHAKSYYEDLIQKSAQETAAKKDVPQVSLYIAKHEDDLLGAIITLFSKTEAIYLYGCSSNVKRNLMPNFLLQWTAMSDAKAYGAKYYDMYGMPPTDDENHPMHGLYQFKTGFGGKNVHRVGTFDVPLKKIYALCSAAEKARAWWHKTFLKRIRGR